MGRVRKAQQSRCNDSESMSEVMGDVEQRPVSRRARPIRPALTPEAREGQLISLATDLAEKQMREGTASAQVIVHYLKLGSTKERIEKEILERQKDLISAKTQALKSGAHIEEMYAEAMNAMRRYGGHGDGGDDA